MKGTFYRRRILFAFCAVNLSVWPLQAQGADEHAAFLINLFIAACIPNMGNPDGVRAWAAAKHLAQIDDPAPLEVFVGPGTNGAAWAIPTQYGKFALSLRGKTQACAVWAQVAEAKDVEAYFRTIVERVNQTGLQLRTDQDTTAQTPLGLARALVYNIVATGASSSYEFTMMTSERAGGAFQASVQVAKASAK